MSNKTNKDCYEYRDIIIEIINNDLYNEDFVNSVLDYGNEDINIQVCLYQEHPTITITYTDENIMKENHRSIMDDICYDLQTYLISVANSGKILGLKTDKDITEFVSFVSISNINLLCDNYVVNNICTISF